jgi:hypothetical protein
MLASEQLVEPNVCAEPHTPVEPAANSDAWQPVAAILHVAQGRPVDSFLSVLPEDANGTVRGPRRSTWRR